MIKKTQAGIATAAILTLGLTACGGDGAAADGTSEPGSSADPLRFAVEEPDTFVPHQQQGSYDMMYALFDPLVTVTDDGELEHQAAESIESDDAVTWTVTLREGWTWHNGEPVTAQNYVDTWNYAVDPDNALFNSAQLSPIVGYDAVSPAEGEPTAEELTGLEVIDDRTFTIELQSPDRQFPLQLSKGQTGLYPLPDTALEDIESWNDEPIGNGPFALTDGWSPTDPIEFEVYEDYAGETPEVDAVTFVPYVDTNSSYTDAQAGQVDIATLAANQVEQARNDFGDKVHELNAPGVDFLGFPLDDDRFSDPDVRRAFSMAIDREAINEAIFGGSQIPATSLTSPSMPGDPGGVCEACEFAPEAAQELLAEAGGMDGSVEILYVANWGQESLFEALANQLRQNLEIDVTAEAAVDFADFQQRIEAGEVNGPYRARWGALYPSQQNTLNAVFTASGEGNIGSGGYSDPEVNELLMAADAAETMEESFEIYAEAQQRILEDFPTVPLFGNRYIRVTSERVTEVESSAGTIELRSVVLEN